MSLKWQCEWNEEGKYYELNKGVKVPVRLFLTEKLFQESEEEIYRQIVSATEFPGVEDVVITPDVHTGYVVPVGCVMATNGTLCQAPVGFDIGCFTGDTLVLLGDDRCARIDALATNSAEIEIYAVSASNQVVRAKAIARKTRPDAPLVQVTLADGHKIRCTPDHEFMLHNGCYAQASDLRPAMRLRHILNMAASVETVEPLAAREDVYCLTVPEHGNFALDAGVFVHNCGMMAFKSTVSMGKGKDEKLRQKFSEQVMKLVGMGAGHGGQFQTDKKRFGEIVRFGASALGMGRENSERDFIPVDDTWDIPDKPLNRGLGQLGSLGGGKVTASRTA